MAGGSLSIAPPNDFVLTNPISLIGDAAIELQGNHVLDIQSAIDGGFKLKVNSGGDLTFSGVLGGQTRLGTLDAIASGVLTLGPTAAIHSVNDIRLGAVQRFLHLGGVHQGAATAWDHLFRPEFPQLCDGGWPVSEMRIAAIRGSAEFHRITGEQHLFLRQPDHRVTGRVGASDMDHLCFALL